MNCSRGTLAYSVNAIVVPRSIFLETKLKADFSAGNHYPLADACPRNLTSTIGILALRL